MRRLPVSAIAATAALLGALSGCAGGDDPPAAAGPSASPKTAATSTAAPAATPAPQDLLSFSCRPGADGKSWSAQGVIVNSARKADYRVTVLVASPGSAQGKARRLVIPNVATGVDTPFDVDRLPVNSGPASACRVQLVRLS
ncbi:hypothetical protein [Mumia zhuanghuii]|uniref:hypothetical protein n=1 Tax=Mumia zhuanghuii TaxID=2585211 RepID=UPI001891C969|nr:hypothetical protein [Mumia zhuanghuii]